MKNHLNFFYKQNKFEMIFTMVFGLVASIWKISLNYYIPLLSHDLKFNFAARMTILKTEYTSQIIVMVIDIFLPVIVISLNIKSNDFQRYIYNLMKGYDLSEHFFYCSIFIRSRRRSTLGGNDLARLINKKIMHSDYTAPDRLSINTLEPRRDPTFGYNSITTESEDSEDRQVRYLYKTNYEMLNSPPLGKRSSSNL
jgi:hypothetical protein